MLADRGQIDLEAPIAEYWPEFAQAGKEGIKVRHFLSHWCGVWANDRAIAGDIYDPEAMEKVIAMQSPAWPIERPPDPRSKIFFLSCISSYLAYKVFKYPSRVSRTT